MGVLIWAWGWVGWFVFGVWSYTLRTCGMLLHAWLGNFGMDGLIYNTSEPSTEI